MYKRRSHYAKYRMAKQCPAVIDFEMERKKHDDSNGKKEETNISTSHAKALTSKELVRGGVPSRRAPRDRQCDSPMTTEGVKRSLFLLLRAMERDATSYEDNTDARMLFSAIRKGKIRLTKFILDAAPNDIVNYADFKGKTPLIIACALKEELSRDLLVSLLINYDADVNLLDDDGRTALSHACEKRCNDIVDILVKQANVDPDIPDNFGNTALMHCAKVGNDVAIDILTRHFRRLGLDVDHVNKDGFTALLMAAKLGNITCAKLLIEQGHASLLHRDKKDGLSTQEWLLHNGFTWEDIAPLTTRLRSRARFLKAIHVARLSTDLQRGDKVAPSELRIPHTKPPNSLKSYGKAIYPSHRREGHHSHDQAKAKHQSTPGNDFSDQEFSNIRFSTTKMHTLNSKMKLPKIEVSSAKLHSQKVSHKMHASRSDIRHESPVGKLDASTSSSDVSSDEEQENEEDGIGLNMEFYGPQFRKHRSLDEPLQNYD